MVNVVVCLNNNLITYVNISIDVFMSIRFIVHELNEHECPSLKPNPFGFHPAMSMKIYSIVMLSGPYQTCAPVMFMY